jgi:cupin fold WbuC family metalloprotein
MKKIYSRIKPDLLLHIINYVEDIDKRCDICPPNEFLQVASFKLMKNKTFQPHKHIKKLVAHDITQETWIVIRGSIEAILYDIDDTILERVLLKTGDCSITFRGGHNYLCLEDDTLVIEVKDGPYLGQNMDKKFI